MATSYRILIQNLLTKTARASAGFLSVSYDVDGTAVLGEPVFPKSCYANETRSTFDEPRLNRQSSNIRERATWEFDLLVLFDGEVTGEAFEEEVAAAPLVLARDSTSGRNRQAVLRLRECVPEHSPQHDAESGSRLRYVFEASLSPL